MTRSRAAAGAFGILVAATSLAAAEPLRVTVISEQNAGVRSSVFVYKNSDLVVFGATDDKGVFEREHKCDPAHSVSALAMDKGSFLGSRVVPCTQIMTVQLKNRTMPKSLYTHSLEQILLPDGSPGLVGYVGFIKTDKIGGQKGKASCDVKVSAILNQQIFKVGAQELTYLKSGQTPAAVILAEAGGPYEETATFPFDCETASGRIQTLEMATAGRIDAALKIGLPTDKTIKILELIK